MMKKLLFSVTLLLVTHLTLFPQAVTYKWLEEKNNLNEKGFFGDAIKTMPIFIPEDAIQKAVNEYNKNSLDTTAAKTNLLIGYPMPFNISAEQSTKLTMITGETLRKLTICAKGAAGLTLIFSELSLVHGSKMIIYDYDGLKKLDRNLITLKFLSYEKIKTKIHI